MHSRNMKRDAQWIANAVDLVLSACGTIEEAKACDVCPLWAWCIDGESFGAVASAVTTDKWEEFLGLSDDVVDYYDEQDVIANLADMERKEIDHDEYY